MNDSQFPLLRSLYATVARVGDAFGSEATSSGMIFPCALASLAEAARVFLPETWNRHPLDFGAFVDRYARPIDDPAIHAFIQLAQHLQPDAAYLAPKGFDPTAQDRGGFAIVLFLHARETHGANLLIVFDRVET